MANERGAIDGSINKNNHCTQSLFPSRAIFNITKQSSPCGDCPIGPAFCRADDYAAKPRCRAEETLTRVRHDHRRVNADELFVLFPLLQMCHDERVMEKKSVMEFVAMTPGESQETNKQSSGRRYFFISQRNF